MSRASISTLLSLDRWAAVIGLNPWHFSQAISAAWPVSQCDDLTYQYAWHDADKVAREDISRAIAQAEHDIAQQCGFWPAPHYEVEEQQSYPRHHDRRLYNTDMRQPRGDRKSVRTDWRRLRAVGVESKTLIQAGAAVVIAGETATVTAATTITDPAEIAVYFQVADGADVAASESYRIKPVSVSISGGVATITGKKWLFFDPDLWEAASAIDADAAASYVTAIDVYRRRTDPSDMGDLIWSTDVGCSLDPLTTAADAACEQYEQTMCLWVRDWDRGIVVPSPATWNATTVQYDETSKLLTPDPDKVRLNYLAGWPLGADGEMADYWARAVAYYSLALLDRPLCSCDNVTARTERWREDLALQGASGSSSRSHQISDLILNSPFGTMRGAVFAWQRCREQAEQRAIIV